MRYLRCPACAELVDASLDVCPYCTNLMRMPRPPDDAPDTPRELADPEPQQVPKPE